MLRHSPKGAGPPGDVFSSGKLTEGRPRCTVSRPWRKSSGLRGTEKDHHRDSTTQRKHWFFSVSRRLGGNSLGVSSPADLHHGLLGGRGRRVVSGGARTEAGLR